MSSGGNGKCNYTEFDCNVCPFLYLSMCTVCVRKKCVTSIQVIKTIQYIKIWAYCHKVYEDLFERKIQYYSPSTNRESSNISQGRYLVISAFRKMTIEDFFYIFLVCLRFQQKIRSIIRFSMVLSL